MRDLNDQLVENARFQRSLALDLVYEVTALPEAELRELTAIFSPQQSPIFRALAGVLRCEFVRRALEDEIQVSELEEIARLGT